MDENQTQEYINQVLIDIERKTNVGEFHEQHEKTLINLIHEVDSSWSDVMFEFLIDSPICDTYPKVMNQLIERINPYFFNHDVIHHILISKCELEHVAFLEKIYEKTKKSYNQNVLDEIANKVEQLFFKHFQNHHINIDDCVNFLVNQKMTPNYEAYQYKISFCYEDDFNDFKNKLNYVTQKCIRLDKDFFLTYLENLRDYADPDEIEIMSQHVPFVEKTIEKYKIQKESLSLDLLLDNSASQKKKIKI